MKDSLPGRIDFVDADRLPLLRPVMRGGAPVVVPECSSMEVRQALAEAAAASGVNSDPLTMPVEQRVRAALATGGALTRVELGRNILRDPSKVHRAPGGKPY
jgi:hypothetical protein